MLPFLSFDCADQTLPLEHVSDPRLNAVLHEHADDGDRPLLAHAVSASDGLSLLGRVHGGLNLSGMGAGRGRDTYQRGEWI